MNSSEKLLILGFDGADPGLLQRWLAEGHFPNIEKIFKEGVFGPLESVPNMGSPASWSTFATGKNAGKHGIFSFTERDFTSYRYKFINGGYRRATTFWEMLCGERKGCIVNVPMSYPADKINGCMLAGFDAPGVESPGFCQPEDLIGEMTAKNGPYKIIRDVGSLLRKGGDWGQAGRDLLDYMEMRYRHMSYLLENKDWQVACVVFGETDHVQHFYWKFLDPTHPDYSEEEDRKYGGTILSVYQRMDDIIGRFIADNPEATILIVSDHGGGMNSRGGQLVPDWLERMGLMATEQAGSRSARGVARSTLRKVAKWGYGLANRHLSTEMKFKLMRRLPMLRESVEAARRLGGIDWSRTKAYSDGIQDDIWINLAGRDPLGQVTEAEYDQLCETICEELRDAVDASTGLPIVKKVFRKDEAYRGECIDRAPDISILWNQERVITGIRTKNTVDPKPVDWAWESDIFNGGHDMDGIVLAYGPRIARGIRLENANIIDIAPTILHFFGEEIPEDFDGKVLSGIFDKEYLDANPPRYGGKTGVREAGKEDLYSEEDNAVIEQRLRDLGYI